MGAVPAAKGFFEGYSEKDDLWFHDYSFLDCKSEFLG